MLTAKTLERLRCLFVLRLGFYPSRVSVSVFVASSMSSLGCRDLSQLVCVGCVGTMDRVGVANKLIITKVSIIKPAVVNCRALAAWVCSWVARCVCA